MSRKKQGLPARSRRRRSPGVARPVTEVAGGIELAPFVVADGGLCVQCKVCEVACHAWHHGAGGTVGACAGPVLPRLHVRGGLELQAPGQCRHCEAAPCAVACKKKAVRFSQGRVLVDEAKCRSCPECVAACPFGAMKLAPAEVDAARARRKRVTRRQYGLKCDLCLGRPEGPVCVEVCPEKALRLVEPRKEKREKSSEAARTILGVRLTGSRRGAKAGLPPASSRSDPMQQTSRERR